MSDALNPRILAAHAASVANAEVALSSDAGSATGESAAPVVDATASVEPNDYARYLAAGGAESDVRAFAQALDPFVPDPAMAGHGRSAVAGPVSGPVAAADRLKANPLDPRALAALAG